MNQTRTVVIERNYDYLYDKIYQLSSERDHARATFKSNATTDRVAVVPIYPTMFSDLRHFPRSQIKLIEKDPVPKFVNRHWRGFSDQARLMMTNLSKLGDTSSVISRYLPFNVESAEVGGRDRFRYFRRPIIPFTSQLPPDVILAVNQTENNYQIGEEVVYQAPTRTIGTQTIFRDSEAQTDPFTPEYLVRPGEAPEVLTLASLTCGRGLPAGLHEIEMIDRARHRRMLESQLPPLNDFAQSEKRRKMMDAIETEEWAVREREIEELQQLRLEILIKLLRQREEAYQEMSNQRLDRLWNRKQQEKEKLFYNLRLKYIKAIRQLLKTHKNVENKHVSRDMIKDYADGSSQTWAPLTRVGQFLDRNSQQYLVNNQYLTTYNGLVELEASLPNFVLNPKISIPKQTQYTKAGYKKRKFREEEKLKILHESIKKSSSVEAKVEKPLKFLDKIEKPIPRPPTPRIEEPEEEEENNEREIILLQKIIRGRAIQAMMSEGKQKRKELIDELRSTHSLLTNETEVHKQQKAETISLQRQRMLLEHREEHIDEALSGLEGETMAEMFDFLSKEILRVQEERRIHAFSMLAERERRIREAEQSGLRQVEERRRREQDEIFKQVVKVHQTSVDAYLKEIIDSNIDWSASHISKMEIEDLAKKINEEAYESELTNSNLQQEEVVADLIHNFLIPEVHKQSVQEKIKKNQRSLIYAAHQEIFKVTNDVIQNPNLQDVQVQASDNVTSINEENGHSKVEITNLTSPADTRKDIITTEEDKCEVNHKEAGFYKEITDQSNEDAILIEDESKDQLKYEEDHVETSKEIGLTEEKNEMDDECDENIFNESDVRNVNITEISTEREFSEMVDISETFKYDEDSTN